MECHVCFRETPHLYHKAAVCSKTNILELNKTVTVAFLASDFRTPFVFSKFDLFLWTRFKHFLLYAYCVTGVILIIEDILKITRKDDHQAEIYLQKFINDGLIPASIATFL